MRQSWPSRNQLHIRTVQPAAWKVNLQGAVTVHTARKQPLSCEYHCPDYLQATYSPSPLCFLPSNYSKASDLLTALSALPWFSLLLHFCSQLLGLGPNERAPHKNPGLILIICRNCPQEQVRSSGEAVMHLRELTPPTRSLEAHQATNAVSERFGETTTGLVGAWRLCSRRT